MNEKFDTPEISAVLFNPRKLARTDLPDGARDMDVNVAPDITIGCRFFTADKQAATILFFHGNGETVADYDEIGPNYTRCGVNFLVADYRGYGWSGGTPSPAAMLADTHTIFQHAKAWMAENDFTGPLFLMGRSLGSACAIELAAAHDDDIAGLIIESGFAEIAPLAEKLGLNLAVLDFTEEEGFDNKGKIAVVTKPTFIVHAQFDELIEFNQAEKLHSVSGARNKELQMVPGADHNNILARTGLMYFQVITQFINKVSGSINWRRRRKEYNAARGK